MKISKKGINLIKKHEGLRLEPYSCPAGVPTIGYGNTVYENSRAVSLDDESITEERAEGLLKHILEQFEFGVNKYLTKDINQSQFDALVSFSYNLGLGSLKSSTLLKRVNYNPCDKDIEFQFSRWNKAGNKVLPGLVKRRKEESDLYFQTNK